MNTIKNKLKLLLIVQLICLTSCNQRANKLTELSFELKEEWKKDTFGCLGNRREIIDDSLKSIQKFNGVDVTIFIKNFGKPNYKKENGKNKILLYWVSCGISPMPKKIDTTNITSQINKEAIQLIVEVNENNLIQKIKVIVP